MRLVVVGGGIAGLAGARAARLAAERAGLGLDITLLEAEPRLGGKVLTEVIDGAPVEWGPDSFVASKPSAAALVRELGLGGELVAPATMRAYLLAGGELRPFPDGLVFGIPRGLRGLRGAVRSGIVDAKAAARASVEPLLPRSRSTGDACAAALLRKRLGREWSGRLVEPLLEGVYGAPATELDLSATLPQFAGARSLVLAARRAPSRPGPAFLGMRRGMGSIVAALAAQLAEEDVRLRASALAIDAREGGFAVATSQGEIQADALLVAVPSAAAAGLVETVSPAAADALRGIPFSSSAVVLLRYPSGSLGRPLDASGYLVGAGDGLVHAACTWLSSKWPNLGGQDVRLRAVVTSPAALALGDHELGRRVAGEVGALMRTSAEPAVAVAHWSQALPVYRPGHLHRVRTIERGLPPMLAVAGASYRGVGVPDCISSGQEAALRLVGELVQGGDEPRPTA